MMKRSISLILSAVLAVGMSVFLPVSCASGGTSASGESAKTCAASVVRADAEWLSERLGGIPDGVTVGLSDELGLDMSKFENDGYIIRTAGNETVIAGKTAVGLDKAVRTYANAAEDGKANDMNVTYHEGYRVGQITVAGNDIAGYSILCINDGRDTDSPSYAANELFRLVKKACGADLPIVESAPAMGEHTITISVSDDEALGLCGFRLRTSGGYIVIEGAWDNGCANAVYWMLQEYCGWEDLIFGNSELHEAEFVNIPDGLDITLDPAFDVVDFRCCSPWVLANDRDNKDTKHNYGMVYGARQSSYTPAMGGLEKYHFATLADPISEQICYTSEKQYQEIYESVYAYTAVMLESGKVIGRDFFEIDVSSNDNFNYCRCKNCMKVIKEENGAIAGAVVRFTNRLEEEMSEDFPGLVYQIYAYHGTNPPPVTAPNENVSVTFCLDGSCYKHVLTGGDCATSTNDFAGCLGEGKTFWNSDYAEWLREWCRLSDRVIVWYYTLDNNLHGYDMFHVLYDDLVFMKSIGVQGILIQGDSYSICHRSVDWMTVAADFIWHPDMTEEEYWDSVYRVIEKDYGSPDELCHWLDLQYEAQYRSAECGNCWGYGGIVDVEACDGRYFAEHFDEMTAMFDTAIRRAPSYDAEVNVRKLAIPCLWQGCMYSYFPAYDANDTARLAVLEERYSLLCDCIEATGYSYDGFRVLFWDPSQFQHIGATLEESAWTIFYEYRNELSDPALKQRPAPEGYGIAE